MYGCDCDGVSHLPQHASYRNGAVENGLRKTLDTIETVTGTRPHTCPWRALYDPLVSEVLQLSRFFETGNLAVAVGADPPALLMDAITHYQRALERVRTEDEKIAAQERAQKAKKG